MEKIVKAPICFRPYFKSVIWGGDGLCRYKGVACEATDVGESWEISAVPGHVSVVDGGAYDGVSLSELIDRFGVQLLGEKVTERYGMKFPLLVKLIDANDNLSVQVHPDDKLAMERHNSLGKTEMWYIISAKEGARIYAGLNREITPEEYERKVSDGTFTEVIATHESAPGDVFFLPAGRVHAIGAGNLLAEIQESSDITYRIFDYNRKDASGHGRELHTELAKDAIDYKVYPHYKTAAPTESVADAEIVSCSHFNVHRVKVARERELTFDAGSFTVIMCVEGCAEIIYVGGVLRLRTGHTALLPALLNEVKVKGEATLLTAQSAL